MKLVAYYNLLRKQSPHRPVIGILIDMVCFIPFMLGLGPWSRPNDIRTGVEQAMKETGLSDFGKSDHEKVIERYEVARRYGMERSQGKWTPFGYFVSGEMLKKRMVTKLQFVDYLKKHSSIEKIPIKNPIFVIGFPRTGTTFLHELLGLHPDVKMHYSWEQMDPVPHTDDESLEAQKKDREARYAANKSRFEWTLTIGGDEIQKVHRIGYDEPEECTTPCAMELPWAIAELPWIAFAAKETIALGAGEAFTTYRRFLQLMTWQSPERYDQKSTWMLKCPFHLPYITELHEAFPDATVVWTHRDPVECIASCCSLYETLLHMGMVETSLDRFALGKAVMEYTRLSLDKALNSFKQLGKNIKAVHVRYADNVKDPKSICKTITEQVLKSLINWILEQH